MSVWKDGSLDITAAPNMDISQRSSISFRNSVARVERV